MPIILLGITVLVLLLVAVVVLATMSKAGLRAPVILALFVGVLCGLLVTGGLWLVMDAKRSIERTNLVRAVIQLDELARAGDHAATTATIAACRVDLEGGTDTITALGRLNTKLFQRRQEIKLIDANGRPIAGTK
jgi:hypothetical protein